MDNHIITHYAALVIVLVKIYGGDESDLRVFVAPGRVNLIGEHIDYCGGCVMPAALTMKTTIVSCNFLYVQHFLYFKNLINNAAAKGVMGKIRAVVETMLLSASDPSLAIPTGEFYDCHGYHMGFGYMNSSVAYENGYICSWSLYSYKAAVKEKEEDAYAELERSIVAKLADDIIVGVSGKHVEIIVKKSF